MREVDETGFKQWVETDTVLKKYAFVPGNMRQSLVTSMVDPLAHFAGQYDPPASQSLRMAITEPYPRLLTSSLELRIGAAQGYFSHNSCRRPQPCAILLTLESLSRNTKGLARLDTN